MQGRCLRVCRELERYDVCQLENFAQGIFERRFRRDLPAHRIVCNDRLGHSGDPQAARAISAQNLVINSSVIWKERIIC